MDKTRDPIYDLFQPDKIADQNDATNNQNYEDLDLKESVLPDDITTDDELHGLPGLEDLGIKISDMKTELLKIY